MARRRSTMARACIAIRTDEMIGLQADGRSDVVGFITREGATVFLADAILRKAEPDASGGRRSDVASSPARTASPSVITTVRAIRQLSPIEARRGYPVQLRAVVTSPSAAGGAVFVQDSTAGIYMVVKTADRLEAGQVVEVAGQTGAGDFAPVIDKVSVRVVGTAAHPEPIRVPLNELFTGRYDSQWVEAEGIVQAVDRQNTSAILSIVSGPYSYRVLLTNFGDQPLPTHLVDTKVQIRGACATNFNEKRQLLGIRLQTPGLSIRDGAGTGSGRSTRVTRSTHQHLDAFQPRQGVGPPGQNPGCRHASAVQRHGLRQGCDWRTPRSDTAGAFDRAGRSARRGGIRCAG